MTLRSFLFFITESNNCFLNILPERFFSSLVSLCPLCIIFSNSSFLIMYPRNMKCLFLILHKCVISYSISLKIYSKYLCRTTPLFPQVTASSVKKLSSIYFYINVLISISISTNCYLFVMKYNCVLISFDYLWKTYMTMSRHVRNFLSFFLLFL